MKRCLITTRVSQFPPEHGGAKNIRHLVKSLTEAGVECRVIVKAQSPGEPKRRFAGQHVTDLRACSKDFEFWDEASLSWSHEGIRYQGIIGDAEALATASAQALAEHDPEAFLLCDDALDDGRPLFELAARSGRFVFLAGTIHCLPFGPYSMMPSTEITELVRQARTILVPSEHVRDYLERHLGRTAKVCYPSVFGNPPFPRLGQIQNPYITMINPCPWKGSSIFLRLARARPDLEFAAVPTWGTTPPLLAELATLPNLRLLDETPEIDRIFSQTRVLLAPSLCQEAFGLVSPEALLRGVPVIASDIAGLRESTLGEARLIPVNPLSFDHPPQGDNPSTFVWEEPENDIAPWSQALDELLSDETAYEVRSRRAKASAERFVSKLRDTPILPLLEL